MNAIHKLAENTIKSNYEVEENDKIIALLQETIVDEDEYLRYRISERFNAIMKSLFDAHKKDALPYEQINILKDMELALKDYPAQKEQEEKAQWKMMLFAKQIGLNITELDKEEIEILMKALQKPGAYKQGRRQGGKRR